MSKVLLVDDDVDLLDMLRDYVEQEGFEAVAVHDGDQGVAEALSGRYAIVVLDVMMGHTSGIDALKRIRQESRMPVLMLTAKGDDADRIIGLEFGADDYVPKPCTPRELAARIRAILRRTQDGGPAASQVLSAGALAMWPEQRRATWAGSPLDLTSTEFSLLAVLARNCGRPVSKSELSERAMGRPLGRCDRSIDVNVSSIRQKLGTLADGRSCIQTVYRLGYQLIRD